MQNLNELLKGLVSPAQFNLPLVEKISVDSREVDEHTVFLAYPGVNVDGRDFIEQAIANKAVACIVEADGFDVRQSYSVPIIAIENLQLELSLIAARFYHYPSQQCTVIGVTGTNGKTSCVHFLAQAIQDDNKNMAVLSTLGNGVWPDLLPSPLTTLGPLEVQRQLALFCQQQVDCVAMEVSSHALVQGRVNAVGFDIGVFTNLSQDHLDYHGTMQAYGDAKAQLFAMKGLRKAVVNWDDPFGQRLVSRFPEIEWVGCSLRSEALGLPMVKASSVVISDNRLCFSISSLWGQFDCNLPLLGQFNVQNILSVVAVLGLMGYTIEVIEQKIAGLQPLPGRMETFGGCQQPLVVVDFAHTPDALSQALSCLRQHCQGRLICVFGCGGERDQGKRALMATAAESIADEIIVTNDNPRGESPEQIANAIFTGFASPDKVRCVLNREDAVKYAVQSAKIGDIVLLAGKGHEEYQIIGNQQHFHSDRQLAQTLLKERVYE